MSKPLLLGLLWLTQACLAADLSEAPPLFNSEGYRQAHYRSPTPQALEGVVTLDTAELQQMLRREPHSRLIDVYRRQWLHGRFIADQPHANLPGSLWLANTGDGELAPTWQRYFAANLERATGGNKDSPLIFYCRSDCWLGWNAVRRARTLGYTRLYWYRDGIDAWEQAGLPLQEAEPVPLP